MVAAYETIVCKGCKTRITIRELEWRGDRSAYSLNEHFNADVPCEVCEETYSYRPEDIQLVDAAKP
jgi:redox-regulated HSP33 family molecular chaperone